MSPDEHAGPTSVDRLYFEDVPAERAVRAFGRPRADLTAEQIKAFEDFIMWRLVELSARHELPFPTAAGVVRIEGTDTAARQDAFSRVPSFLARLLMN